MASLVKEKNILLTLVINPRTAWREDISKLKNLGVLEIALFFDSVLVDQRREVYRLLEPLGLTSVPVVRITSDFESWELDYLNTTYHTEIFSLATDNRGLLFVGSTADWSDHIILENPASAKLNSLFNQDVLNKYSFGGLSLDLKILELDRHFNHKKYQATIKVLDQHPLKLTSLGPVANHWLGNLLSPAKRRLTSLRELNYLKNIPTTQYAEMIILNCYNSLEEQLEIKKYLNSFIK